jgi:hypothetical protein
MTTDYRFKAGYTKLGVATAPAAAPTVNIVNVATDILLVTAGVTTASVVMPGVYTYTHTAASGLNLIALFHTTDATVDEQDLFGIDIDAAVVLSGALASTSVAYASLAEFKAYATVRGGVTAVDAGDDAVIEDILKSASRYIDVTTGRRFWYNAVDETRYYTPNESGFLFVDDLAMTPTTLKTDSSYDRTYATTIATTDYDLEPDNALLDGQPYTMIEMSPHATEYFPIWRRGVQIVGKFGFPVVPSDIKGACLGIALNIYQNRSGQSNAGNVTVTAAGVVIRPQDVPAWAQLAINKYRRLI